jgi:xylulokinase
LLDVGNFHWSDEILITAGLKKESLPILVSPGKKIGSVSKKTSRLCGLKEGTPIISGGGDQQCAGIGAGVVHPGIASITVGTAGVTFCFSDKPFKDPKMRVTTCAHAVPGKWEIEGLQNSAGASVNWLDKIIEAKVDSGNKLDALLSQTKIGAGEVSFYPFLSGAGAPSWKPLARGAFFGLTHGTEKTQLIRAVVEGVSFEFKRVFDVLDSMKIPIDEIRLTGGYTHSDCWNDIVSQILGKSVHTLRTKQATLLGAAILAGCGVGAYGSVREASEKMVSTAKRFDPEKEKSVEYSRVYKRYCERLNKLEKDGLLEV